ncbi:acetyl-CoA C-acetyltransferase [Friedmanniella endophytica]|uniref:Acetyl-CoA C-acetyltransferase n=1 Tax=Microlunatus kandeliicorticis TaxID=1759536 RepID=A0A7W3P7M3_9ACTN|nr:acetyl-CoA C-acetyltransferase [Microlunatus kandeliicorticis]MBA8796107.1 acetyl-CoA C-acetyltransferase [Microlunatus kandeliicorticis]
MSPEAVVVAVTRTPIGRAGKGSLVSVRPDDLAAGAVGAALAQVPALDPRTLDDIYVGCAEPRDEHGGNVARRIAVQLGLDGVPAATVNRFCASSVQTVRMAYHAIRSGEGHAFVAAGVECVSRYRGFGSAGVDPADTQNPLFADAQARTRATAEANSRWHDPRDDGELPDVYIAMGQTAENVATLRGISRAEQDEWGVRSQNLAEKAIANGVFEREITPVTLPDGRVISTDDGPRAGTTLEAVSALKPVFRENGTVTAGNCCPLNDGAAAVVIMSDVRADELGLTPLARIVSTGVSALSPEIMGLGPVEASRRALDRAGLSITDIDLYEINEAFAVQVLASAADLGMDLDRLNVHGGAIALGHPFGATGARILTTLLNAMQQRDATFGLETLCVGGGQGMALVLQRLS